MVSLVGIAHPPSNCSLVVFASERDHQLHVYQYPSCAEADVCIALQGCEGVDSRAIKFLRDIPTLKRLNLTACRGVQTAAMRHLRTLTNLEVLSIADLVRVGNGALKYFCSLNKLRTLYVAGCPHITEDGLQLLKHHPVHVYT